MKVIPAIAALAPLALTSLAEGQGACTTPFIRMKQIELVSMCQKAGVEIKEKIRFADPAYHCPEGSDDWRKAKQNVDWVVSGDAGGRRSFNDAMSEFQNGCVAETNYGRELMALYYAQRHAVKAQCEVFQCQRNLTGVNSYFEELKRKRIIK